MKRAGYIFFAILNFTLTSKGYSLSDFQSSVSYEENYSFKTTDSTQKKQAVGMVFSGIVFFVAIALFSGFMPNCPGGSEAPLTEPSTQNTILGG